MNNTFKIVQDIETGDTFLAAPYWLDPKDKFTIFCKYKEGLEPIMGQYGMFNSYATQVNVLGDYKSDKYYRSTNGEITKK